MGTLTGCLKKAGAAIHSDDKAEILERARVLKAEGAQSPAEQAIDEQLAKVRAMIAELGGVADRVQGPKESDQALFSRAPATNTHAFKAWFGASKVVDAEGRPLVVYHGSPDARFLNEDGIFATLKERMLKFGATPQSRKDAEDGRAFFFTSSKGVAKSYADPRRAFDYQNSEPEVIPTYVSIQNPLEYDAAGLHWREAQKNISKDDFIKTAKRNGHDGVIIKNVRDSYDSMSGGKDQTSTVYVAFTSNQIKHAEKNAGTFDPANPDIRMSRADPKPATIHRPQAESLIAKIRKAFPRAPDIILHNTVADAPKALQDRIAEAGAQDDVEAAYHDGKIHVFPQNISSAERMEFVVGRHEIRHAGLDGLLGSRKSAFLRDLYDQNAGLKKAADAKVRDGLASSRDVAVEEALADMPTEAIEALTGWDKAVATIRSALRMLADVLKARGLNRLSKAVNPKGWTDKEIAALVQRAEDMSRAGEGRETLFARAWHGTPHRGIEKFSTDKIGTGEGAQAYGWGLYFASKKEVAEYYRKALSANFSEMRVIVNGRIRKGDPIRYAVEKLAESQDSVSQADVVAYFDAALAKPMPGLSNAGLEKALRREQQKARDEAANAKSFEVVLDKKPGQLYEVEVPEDSELLHWDKPLSEQPEGVRKALSNPELLEGAANVGVEAADLLRNLSERDAGTVQPFSSLDVPSKRIVLAGVRAVLNNLQVRQSVVGLVPVDVVNILTGKKPASKALLDNPSVLFDLFPVDRDNTVPVDINSADAAIRAIALAARAEGLLVHTESVRVPENLVSAMRAGSLDKVHGKQIYKMAERELGSARDASEFLQSVKIPGIKYLDGTSRDGSGDSHNYVIFSGDDVQIQGTMFSRSDAFKKWFADSKVVDAEGKPLVVYHGTKGDFNTFDAKRQGTSDFGASGRGFYFSQDPGTANVYAQLSPTEGASNILPVYLSIKNPYEMGALLPQDEAQSKLLTERVKDEGYDGIIVRGNDGTMDEIIAFKPEQIKSATGNAGTYDAKNPDIRFSRAPTVSDPKSTAIDVRRDKSAWRDSLGRSQFAPGAWAYNKVAPFVNERILTPLKLNAMPPELRTQVRAMKLQIQASKDVAVRVAGEGFKLSEQDRVLVSDIIEGEIAAGTIPPEHAMRMAAGINTIMDQQTNDLVELGMLAKDSAERWRGAYLPRFYKSKLMQTLREGGADLWGATLRKSARKPAVMQGIKGDSLKGRGLWETVPASELASWEAMGWEVRDPDHEAGVSPDVQMWRDYSREERDKMGEIRDAGFRFTMGYLRTQRDIAMGRMFAGIAEDKSMSAKEGRQPANWVQVPDGSIPGTGGVKRYGKLAGMYVAPEVMNHLENHDQGASEALKLYRKALGMWKEGKVVLNPVSHANNMMGNVSMAHFAGVSYWDAHKYAGTINDLVRKSPMVEEARKAGLFLGTMSQEELLTTMPPELRAMAAMQASKAEKSADFVWNVLSMWLRKPAGKLYEAEDLFFRYLIYRDARNQGLSPEDAVDYSQRYIFTYDDLPKGAQQIRDFAVPFFAYTYKAVPALLHTATHYPHRFLAPAGVMWGLNAAMYALAAGEDDEDWTDKILTYINDPERRKKADQIESGERENLPPWMKGNSSVLGSPKAVRLGLDEVTGLPMFWDIAQIMPGGNLFDVENNAGGIGWPQSIMPSHPLLTATAAMFWNKDTFFGKDIVDADDTTGEASQKRATWLWKQITPAIAIGNYHTERLANVVAQMTGEPVTWFPRDATGVGKDGLPVQPKLAAMQTVGIKVRPIDVDMSQQINEGQRAKMIRDIDAEIRRINRLSQKGAMSDRNADTEIELQQTKKDRLREGLTVDGEQPK